MTYWLDGAFRHDPAVIDVADRAFLLGDGVFETILMVDGVPAFWDGHMARLRNALSALKFSIMIDEAALFKAARRLAEKKEAGAAVLRVTVTRGPGQRGLLFPAGVEQRPSLLMTVSPAVLPKSASAAVMLSCYVRSEASVSARFKTPNYLDNVMARQEAAGKGCDEAIMLNGKGRVACASAANVFIVTEAEEVITPPVGEGALPGIVRGLLLGQSQAIGAPMVERPIDLEELQRSEIFLTSSLIGVRPARLTKDKASEKSPSRFITAAQARYKKLLQDDLTRGAQQS